MIASLPREEPKSASEVGEAVRLAAERQWAVYPLGGATMIHVGGTPTRPGRVIDLRRLNQIVDYPARDMTVTVQAGITIDQLQKVLRSERQRLPVDVPLPHRATLGGALSCNASGPLRYGYGTFRDYVIGISVINDRGEEVKAGGRVVKNVAGYDLCKLYIGSLGTLGIVTQVTLKVRPMPETAAASFWRLSRDRIDSVLDRVHQSQTCPAAVELVNSRSANKWLADFICPSDTPEASWWLVLIYDGGTEAVSWQSQQIRSELASEDIEYVKELTSSTEVDAVRQRLCDFSVGEESAQGEYRSVAFRAGVLSSRVGELCRLADSLGGAVVAHAGNGIVVGWWPPSRNLAEAQTRIDRLRQAASPGYVVVPFCPDDWKQPLDIWGRRRGDWAVMQQVKQALDPHQLFNPGRFVAGI